MSKFKLILMVVRYMPGLMAKGMKREVKSALYGNDLDLWYAYIGTAEPVFLHLTWQQPITAAYYGSYVIGPPGKQVKLPLRDLASEELNKMIQDGLILRFRLRAA